MKARCSMCGSDLEHGAPFVMLNRYAVSTGHVEQWFEARDDEQDYQWDDDGATGVLLCPESCLSTWIEGTLIALRAKSSKQAGGRDADG